MLLTKLKYKILLIAIFICLTIVEIKSHSLHWRSAADGIVYLFGNGQTWDEDFRLQILENNYLVSTVILSILLLVFKSKFMIILILIFMIFHLFIFLPCNYLSEHDLNIDF